MAGIVPADVRVVVIGSCGTKGGECNCQLIAIIRFWLSHKWGRSSLLSAVSFSPYGHWVFFFSGSVHLLVHWHRHLARTLPG